MLAVSREDLLKAFDMQDRKLVKQPLLPDSHWSTLDFLGWIHPSGHLGFVLHDLDGSLRGIVLERNVIRASQTGATRRYLCSACLTVHPAGGTAYFSRRSVRAKEYRVRAQILCSDLACSRYVRGLARSPAVQMAETLTEKEKIIRLRENILAILNSLEAV